MASLYGDEMVVEDGRVAQMVVDPHGDEEEARDGDVVGHCDGATLHPVIQTGIRDGLDDVKEVEVAATVVVDRNTLLGQANPCICTTILPTS